MDVDSKNKKDLLYTESAVPLDYVLDYVRPYLEQHRLTDDHMEAWGFVKWQMNPLAVAAERGCELSSTGRNTVPTEEQF